MFEKLSENGSVWDRVKECKKPVVLYGMGNGADMVFDVLDGIGVRVSDVFASDDFVRGHYFHGYRVLKYSEVCEKHDDFIILMTFAVHDAPTMERVWQMSCEHELLSPTVPIAGKELFTPEFIKNNEAEFDEAYALLADEKSHFDFLSVLNFKLSGKIKYLLDCQSEKSELYSTVFPLEKNEVIVDLGAYDGDTIREFLSYTGGEYKKIHAFEPDGKNYTKLCRYTAGMDNAFTYQLGAWDKQETVYFSKKKGRNSHIADDETGIPVTFNSVDNVIADEITLLKMDIEGAEAKAVDGARNCIIKYRPKLYICAYHRNEDAFVLPKKIHGICPEYKIYYRHHPYIPAWESNFYCVAK